MSVDVRPSTAVLVLFVVIATIAGASLVAADGSHQEQSDQLDTVTLEDGSELWPYTSRGPTQQERTLSINVIVYGDADVTERALRQSSLGDWDDVDEDEQDIAPAEEFGIDGNQTGTVEWGGADGAARYVYVDPAGDGPVWLLESYQLARGDYLGDRRHVRAYEDPDGGEWTAMQAHDEHWDWFHLRHTVHTIEGSQLGLEEEFVGQWYVEDLSRERFGNDGSSDADGWVTVVDLEDRAPYVLFAGLVLGSLGATRTIRDLRNLRSNEDVRTIARSLAAVGLLVALYLAVRFGAIGIERLATDLNPKLVVAVFYPALVVGLPIAAYLATRQLDRAEAFTAASLGFTVAIFLDYTMMGVGSLPLDTVVHRGALAIAIGLIAAGASQTARKPDTQLGYVRAGALLWAVAVAVPLLQFL